MAYKCPNDPKKQYHNKHCKERQRTLWMKATCNGCHHFPDVPKKKEVDDATSSNQN